MGQAYDAVQRYIDAMKRKDLEASLDAFCDDAVYYLHVGTRPFDGKEFMLWKSFIVTSYPAKPSLS